MIGERLNPTGKKKLQQALREGDIDYVDGNHERVVDMYDEIAGGLKSILQ